MEIKKTVKSYCQACGRDFESPELVYYAPVDNTIVCRKCSEIHKDRELRIFISDKQRGNC